MSSVPGPKYQDSARRGGVTLSAEKKPLLSEKKKRGFTNRIASAFQHFIQHGVIHRPFLQY
jgi:uncharacterized damage-inducible protein DinB